MKIITWIGLLIFLLANTAEANTSCVRIAVSGWTVAERFVFEDALNTTAHNLGEPSDVVQLNRLTGKVCWEDPIIDLTTITTTSALTEAQTLVATECVLLDMSAWTDDQIREARPIVVSKMLDAGETAPIVLWDSGSGSICFDSPVVLPSSVLTEQVILDQYAVDEAARQAAEQVIIDRQNELDAESTTNVACNADWETVRDRLIAEHDLIDANIDGLTNIASVKTFLRQSNDRVWQTIGRLGRCLMATKERNGL